MLWVGGCVVFHTIKLSIQLRNRHNAFIFNIVVHIAVRRSIWDVLVQKITIKRETCGTLIGTQYH